MHTVQLFMVLSQKHCVHCDLSVNNVRENGNSLMENDMGIKISLEIETRNWKDWQ